MKLLLSLVIFALLTPSSKHDTYILISKPDPIIGCGGILWAGQFQLMKTTDSTTLIGIILCPDGLGDKFFKENYRYEIELSEDSTLPKGYSFMNEFRPDFYVPKRIITDIKVAKP